MALVATADKLICDKEEIFRLCYSLYGDKAYMLHYNKYISSGKIPELVYDFCIDIMSERIYTIVQNKVEAFHPQKRKAKKR